MSQEHGCGDYFLLEHYVPESLILNTDRYWPTNQLPSSVNVLKTQLHQAHRERRGLDATKAVEMFITHAQALADYGSHYYIATLDTKQLNKMIYRLRKSQDKRAKNADKLGKTDLISELANNNCQELQYASPKAVLNNNQNVKKSNQTNKEKSSSSSSNIWLAIHAQGIKVLDRGDRPRERTELAAFQWKDIQTLSYSKSCLLVYTRINGKRCKFKLRMDQRK